MSKDEHECSGPGGTCGELREKGRLYLWGGEPYFEMQVNYCPYCGKEAEKKIDDN